MNKEDAHYYDLLKASKKAVSNGYRIEPWGKRWCLMDSEKTEIINSFDNLDDLMNHLDKSASSMPG